MDTDSATDGSNSVLHYARPQPRPITIGWLSEWIALFFGVAALIPRIVLYALEHGLVREQFYDAPFFVAYFGCMGVAPLCGVAALLIGRITESRLRNALCWIARILGAIAISWSVRFTLQTWFPEWPIAWNLLLISFTTWGFYRRRMNS